MQKISLTPTLSPRERELDSAEHAVSSLSLGERARVRGEMGALTPLNRVIQQSCWELCYD
jgi:hypothetical protein